MNFVIEFLTEFCPQPTTDEFLLGAPKLPDISFLISAIAKPGFKPLFKFKFLSNLLNKLLRKSGFSYCLLLDKLSSSS